jgi:sodium/potassium-transporting ATPase subunit alpha
MAKTHYHHLLLIAFERCNSHSPIFADDSLGYFFGGFGGLLFIAGIICIICYKPLGNPSPDPSNLALGVLLFLVITIQAVFNAWQDYVRSLTAQS